MSLQFNLSDIELHDALLLGIDVNFQQESISLRIDFYKSSSDGVRYPLEIRFEGVRSVAGICDFESLRRNAFAGNVNYWNPGKVTHIYLTDGCISIVANNVICEISEDV